jgi:hypothetical protein
MHSMAEQPKPLIVDNPTVPVAYANKFIASSFDGGAVSLTFGTINLLPERIDTQPAAGSVPAVHVSARLTLSPAATVELMNGLSRILQTLAKVPGSGIAITPPAGAAGSGSATPAKTN